MKVYIVHGYGGTPEKHWFPYLASELEALGIDCLRLEMPDTENPHPEKWLDHLRQQVQIDEQTVIIGHSLGCIASLNFLARGYEKPKAAIFVSGFYQPLDNLPELTPFSNLYAVSPPLMPFPTYVISAVNDTVVPHEFSDRLAQHLGATYLRFPQGGHFLEEEGWQQFPALLKLIKTIFALD